MKTRIVSILLACVMLLALVPSLVLATDAEAAFVSSFFEDAQANITYDTEAQTVTYAGNWKAAVLSESTRSPIYLDRLHPQYEKETEAGIWALTETAHSDISTEGWSAWWWGSMPGSGLLNLTDFRIGLSNPNGVPMYVYTVPEEGEFSIAVELEQFTAPAAPNGEFYFAVMVNEQMVWPSYGAQYSFAGAWESFVDTTGAWYHVTAETTLDELNEALSTLSVKVKKDDRVEFCYRSACDLSDYNISVKEERDVAGGIFGKPIINAMPKITATVADAAQRDYYLAIREDGVQLSATKIEGDTFTLPEYTGSAIFLGWDVNGDGIVDRKPGDVVSVNGFAEGMIYVDSITAGKSSFLNYHPTLDDKQFPVFSGGWIIGAYEKSTDLFHPYSSKADKWGIISTGLGKDCWSGKGGGMYVTTGKIAFSGSEPAEDFLNEIKYTVPYNGQVQFGLDKIDCRREVNKPDIEDYIEFNFAVYVNGEKVWPTDSEMFAVKSTTTYTDPAIGYDAMADFEAAGFPLNLTVNKGDVISFRMQEGNSNSWMMFAEPYVSYTELTDTPVVVGSSVTLDAEKITLDMNIHVQAIAKRENAVVGLEYWLTEPTEAMKEEGGTKLEGILDEKTGNYIFTYGDLAAKQMADVIYARPYSAVDTDVIKGAVTAVSIQSYADAAIGRGNTALDNLLVALLNYGKAAQDLFDYNTANPANSNLTGNQKEQTLDDVSVLADVYANAEGDNKITNVSLILGNELGMKYMINSVEGATTYALEYSKNADFTESTTIEMTGAWENRQQKAICYIGLEEIDDTFYVRAVVDGVPGATLTYSVESYILRMQECESLNLWYTINALGYLDQMIEAYQA